MAAIEATCGLLILSSVRLAYRYAGRTCLAPKAALHHLRDGRPTSELAQLSRAVAGQIYEGSTEDSGNFSEMKEMTLDQIAKQLVAVYQRVPISTRPSFEQLVTLLRTPVGRLGSKS